MRFLLPFQPIVSCIAACAFGQVMAQSQPHGMLRHAETLEPVPFANIAVRGKPLGTISDSSGRFQFPLSAQVLPGDTLLLTAIGYESQSRRAADCHPCEVSLVPRELTTAAVDIVERELAPVWEGRDGTGTAVQLSITPQDIQTIDTQRGAELALTLRAAEGSYLKAVRFYILKHPFDSLLLRLRIYTVEKGKPAQELTQTDHLLRLTRDSAGWQEFRLDGHLLALPPRFAVSLEFLSYKVDPKRVFEGTLLPAGLTVDNQLFARKNQAEDWRRPPLPLTVSLQALVLSPRR